MMCRLIVPITQNATLVDIEVEKPVFSRQSAFNGKLKTECMLWSHITVPNLLHPLHIWPSRSKKLKCFGKATTRPFHPRSKPINGCFRRSLNQTNRVSDSKKMLQKWRVVPNDTPVPHGFVASKINVVHPQNKQFSQRTSNS